VPTSSAGAAANACGLPSSGVSPVAPEIVHDRPPSMLTLMVPAPSKPWIVPDGPSASQVPTGLCSDQVSPPSSLTARLPSRAASRLPGSSAGRSRSVAPLCTGDQVAPPSADRSTWPSTVRAASRSDDRGSTDSWAIDAPAAPPFAGVQLPPSAPIRQTPCSIVPAYSTRPSADGPMA